MKFLFLFLDGVGLGADDPATNPLAAASMPHLETLLEGQKMLAHVASLANVAPRANRPPLADGRATLLALDAGLGVEGLPQSASGQAALLTGKNVPAIIGGHWGPKPNPPIAEILKGDTLFKTFHEKGLRIALLGAYPPGYFQAIEAGRRMYSAIPLAVTNAGVPLMTKEDYDAGRALTADFTGEGWREFLGYTGAPLFTPHEAGRKLAALSRTYDFAFFEFWMSDTIGHKQDMEKAVNMLANFDEVLGGLLQGWKDEEGLILLTSDHGNLEDLSTRRHTANPVPGLVIGPPALRAVFVEGLKDLTDVAPAILRMFEL